jgi:hypothetical protein
LCAGINTVTDGLVYITSFLWLVLEEVTAASTSKNKTATGIIKTITKAPKIRFNINNWQVSIWMIINHTV